MTTEQQYRRDWIPPEFTEKFEHMARQTPAIYQLLHSLRGTQSTEDASRIFSRVIIAMHHEMIMLRELAFKTTSIMPLPPLHIPLEDIKTNVEM